MTGNTITSPGPAGVQPARVASITASRAARELGLRRGEFELAVQLGRIRTIAVAERPDEPPGTVGPTRRVTNEEIDRIRATDGGLEALRAGISTVSAIQGAELMAITSARFTRLAKLGLLVPVKFYLNRYRTVVWLYLAEELRSFAEAEANEAMLANQLPETLRARLDSGADLRARNWRGRHAGMLLRLTTDPWARAAITASLLAADGVADIVGDPSERAYLSYLKPERPYHSAPGSIAAQVVDDLMTADEPDEIAWLRSSLSTGLAEARTARPAPRPAPGTPLAADPRHRAQADSEPESATPQSVGSGCTQAPGHPPDRPRSLLARLRLRRK